MKFGMGHPSLSLQYFGLGPFSKRSNLYILCIITVIKSLVLADDLSVYSVGEALPIISHRFRANPVESGHVWQVGFNSPNCAILGA